MLEQSELILNPDGSIYHLGLLPGEVSETIITVGDPNRVEQVSKYFDKIEVHKKKREFITVTGYLGTHRLTVVSTGIGTDNIDIVLHELDALFNIDFSSRKLREEAQSLKIIRLGTSGSFNPDVPVDQIVNSMFAVGADNLLAFYKKEHEETSLTRLMQDWAKEASLPLQFYAYRSGQFLGTNLPFIPGITLTASGFYGPQTRMLRLEPTWNGDHLAALSQLRYEDIPFTNLEMESSGIFGLGREMGHQCMSINAILANRSHGTFSKDPKGTVEEMIKATLDILCDSND